MSKQTDLINVTDAITVSGSNVGIGTNSPSSYTANGNNLVIEDTNVGMTLASNSTNGSGAIYFADGTGGTSPYRGIILYTHASDKMGFFTASTERMRIDATGAVTMPAQPAFNVKWATSSSTAPVGIDTVAFSQVITNVGSHYNSSTGRFTAPVSGFYQFNLSMYFQNGTNYVGSMLQKSDGAVYYSFLSIGADVMCNTSQAVYLNQNDYVFTRSYCGGSTTALRQHSHFSGYLIG